MTVLEFPPKKIPPGWRFADVQTLRSACADTIARGEASGWEIGETEAGDPQLYLLGPAPDYECLLCISRLGRVYVLEDGNGRVLIEDNGLITVAQHVRDALSRKKGAIVARITVAWYAFRETIEDKTEAVLAETHEVLVHFAPQVVALV